MMPFLSVDLHGGARLIAGFTPGFLSHGRGHRPAGAGLQPDRFRAGSALDHPRDRRRPGFVPVHACARLDRFHTQVASLLSATVLIAFAINDCYVCPWRSGPRVGLAEFRRNFAELGAWSVRLGGTPVLIAPHRMAEQTHAQGSGATLAANLEPYAALSSRPSTHRRGRQPSGTGPHGPCLGRVRSSWPLDLRVDGSSR